MANYSVQNSSNIAAQQSLATTYKTLVALMASTGATGPGFQVRRGKLYDLAIGTNGTAADNSMEWDIARVTAGSTFVYAGIVSSIGQQQLDPADANMAAFAVVNSTSENFTVTANSNLFYLGMNQRASYRWVAAPGSELVWPAASSAGLVLRARSAAYTGTATAAVYFSEQ